MKKNGQGGYTRLFWLLFSAIALVMLFFSQSDLASPSILSTTWKDTVTPCLEDKNLPTSAKANSVEGNSAISEEGKPPGTLPPKQKEPPSERDTVTTDSVIICRSAPDEYFPITSEIFNRLITVTFGFPALFFAIFSILAATGGDYFRDKMTKPILDVGWFRIRGDHFILGVFYVSTTWLAIILSSFAWPFKLPVSFCKGAIYCNIAGALLMLLFLLPAVMRLATKPSEHSGGSHDYRVTSSPTLPIENDQPTGDVSGDEKAEDGGVNIP